MHFYELRQYEIFPGKMDEWIALMEKIKQKQISEENKSVLLFTGGSSYSQLNEPHF